MIFQPFVGHTRLQNFGASGTESGKTKALRKVQVRQKPFAGISTSGSAGPRK
jgi:hypothetical protein